jgi:hypothetical protein
VLLLVLDWMNASTSESTSRSTRTSTSGHFRPLVLHYQAVISTGSPRWRRQEGKRCKSVAGPPL